MKKKFNTKVIHAGHGSDKETGAVMPPIHLSSTFKQIEPGNFEYEYARTKNPSRDVLEKLLAQIESGHKAFAFASGMSAINTVCDLFGTDFHIICSDDVYGGTRRIFDKIKTVNQDVEVTYADLSKENNWQGHLKENTKMIWVETPSNPLLKIIDIKKIRESLKDDNIIIVCDNTFASPYNQQPINNGADVVIHSSTKYLGGHSDLIAGVLVIGKDDKNLLEKMANIQNSLGPITSTFDSYLILRSLKTLSLRMERHSNNALLLANELINHNSLLAYEGLQRKVNRSIKLPKNKKIIKEVPSRFKSLRKIFKFKN